MAGASGIAALLELLKTQQLLTELGGHVQVLAAEVFAADETGVAQCREVL